MSANELISKKREMLSQIEILKRQVEAIDVLLPVFSNGSTNSESPVVPRLGRYSDMSVAKAIVDYLNLQKGVFMTTAEIADGLRREGIPSKSANFTTIVGSTCATLQKEKHVLLLGKKKKKRAYAAPT